MNPTGFLPKRPLIRTGSLLPRPDR
jgi:hypothetical protein